MATPQNNLISNSPIQLSGQPNIDSLLDRRKWGNSPAGNAVQGLEYSFVQSTQLISYVLAPVQHTDADGNTSTILTGQQVLQNFSPLTTPEQEIAARIALDAWAEVANITFREVTETPEIGNTPAQVGDIRFGRSTRVNDNFTAYAYTPRDDVRAGDVWFSTVTSDIDTTDRYNINAPGGILSSKGTYAYQTFLHELGHVLGLKHPHEGAVVDNAMIQESSVMSYRSFVGQTLGDGYSQNFFPTTPMLNDIEAIQYLYGANMTTRPGNDVYNWSYFTENGIYTQFLQTIWDVGGIDRIDWSDAPNQTTRVRINLNAGEWSELGLGYTTGGTTSVSRTVAIARNVTIENATGGGGDDELIGNSVANILNGGSGTDTMRGGQGNDTYYVDYVGDNVIELADEGTDIVFSSVSYSLSDNVENLTLTGNKAINGYGNSLDNLIIGNNSDNALVAGDGNDVLYGEDGDDKLSGDVGADIVDGGNGIDTAFYSTSTTGVSVNLSTGLATGGDASGDVLRSIEYLYGSKFGDTLIGDSQNNSLWGIEGDDILDGGLGNDILYGNAGNDTILGGEGDDKLIGGVGADVLNGGNGSDIASYFNATTGVTANLSASQNNTGDAQGDVYQSIENLEGSEFSDRLFGNNENNTLIGLGGDDFLDGYGGNDTLIGGAGNDTYNVDSAGDIATENLNEGTDTVNAAINYTLAANLDNLNLLEGTAALNGTGNELSNTINGNSANNTLNGGAGDDRLYGFAGGDTLQGGDGNDWIVGGQGNDILTGGAGNDSFVYNGITDAGDRITDFTVGSDKIVLTDLLKNLGYQGSNAITNGLLSFKQASASLAVIQIDPDGTASNLFRPAPFILLDNVSVTALNNPNNFVF